MKNMLLFITALLTSTALLAQTADEALRLEGYAKNIAQFNRNNPQEKVYLHMDNRSYFIGDTIFFKAYVLNASTLQRTKVSEVLYVELLNESGIEMEHKKLKVVGGVCHGSFILKDSYRTGYYEIRAYTRYMLNFGNEKMPWMNIHKHVKEKNLNPYAITPEQRMTTSKPTLESVFPTPIWDQSIVADANHCQFTRVFPVYMKPEKPGEYKREKDWYPIHTQLAYPKETEEELRDDSLRIAFYPEGGMLVAGTASRIAIDVSDQWGREKSISGHITEGRNGKDTLATFRAGRRGRGTFTLTPERGKHYYAHIAYKDKEYRYALPQVDKSGYALCLTAPIAQGDAAFTVCASGIPDALIGWTLQCRGALTAFDTIGTTANTVHEVTIPRTNLIPGVNQLTLFNARGEVLAERLFFVSPPKERSTLSITTQLPDSLAPFEKVTLDFQAMAANGYFDHTHFSLSVTDAGECDETFDTGDIHSEMLLSSDLKGFIKDVDSYFRHTNDTAMRNDIDLLMMVQGWRRYEWQTMAGTVPYTPRYTPEYGLQLDGYVITDEAPEDKFADASSYKRLGNVAAHVTMIDPLITVDDTCHADSLGNYHMAFKRDFFGEVPMTIELRETADKAKRKGLVGRLKYAYPIIHRAFSPATTPYDYYQHHSPHDDELRTVINNYDWQMEGNIENVDIRKRHKQSSELYLDRPEIVVDYYKEWNYTIDRGIPNANIYDHKQYYANERDIDAKEAFLMGDEEYTHPSNENNEIRLNYTLGRSRLWGRIARLEDSLFTYTSGRKSRYQVYLMPKKINVYTNLVSREALSTPIDDDTDTRPFVVWKPEYYKRSLSPRTAPYMLKDGVRNTFIEGYSRVVSFYHRDYSGDELPDSADYRRTLYWNPSITTTPIGKAQVTFYNNARAKRIHIRAEGISRYGGLVVYDSEKK